MPFGANSWSAPYQTQAQKIVPKTGCRFDNGYVIVVVANLGKRDEGQTGTNVEGLGQFACSQQGHNL